jgi:serine/threonine-protein kinase
LVHRDIKPANLVLTLAKGEALRASLSGALSGTRLNSSNCYQGGVIKIMDLGLACLQKLDDDENRITLEGLIVGTPDFLAPEQARHSSSVDSRADIYGLGGTLFFLLTARLPFPDGTPTEKILKHATFPVPDVKSLRPDVSSELAALAHKMMAKAPKDRVQTATEVALALERFSLESASPVLMHEGMTATTTTNGKSVGSGWIWRIVLGLAAVCLVGGVIGLLVWVSGL